MGDHRAQRRSQGVRGKRDQRETEVIQGSLSDSCVTDHWGSATAVNRERWIHRVSHIDGQGVTGIIDGKESQ